MLWPKRSTDTQTKPRLMTAIDLGTELAAANGKPDLDEIIMAPVETEATIGFDGPEHILSLGPTRSGKGRKLLAPAIILAPKERSIVVIDPKGELAKWTLTHRRDTIGSEVCVIDPFGILARTPGIKLPSMGYNPMRWLDPDSDDFVDNATAIAEAICPIDSKEPIFDEGAQDLITGLIMYHRLLDKYALRQESGATKVAWPKAGLADFRSDFARDAKGWHDLIYGGLLRDAAGNIVKDPAGKPIPTGHTKAGKPCVIKVAMDADVPALETKLLEYGTLSPENRTLLSFIQTAKTKTKFLDSPAIARDLAMDGVDFHGLKKVSMTVYLVLPPKQLVTHAKWLRMIITGAIDAMRVTDPIPDDRPEVLMILDEFPQLGHLQSVETGVSLNAGYGIKFWVMIQNKTQLSSLYPQSWETFASSGALTSFAPRDPTTSEYLRDLAGERGIAVKGISTGSDGNRNISQNEQRRENVMPHQFRQMREGMMFVRLPSRTRGERLYIARRSSTRPICRAR
jgi:type IV secretion system protein VirD4